MSYALCEHIWDKKRNPENKTTEIVETMMREYFDDFETPSFSKLSSRIDELIRVNNATVTVTDIQKKSETLICDKETFDVLIEDYSDISSLLQLKITCSFEMKLFGQDVYNTRELTWEDYFYAEKSPMLDLQIFDGDSGCLLESRMYRTHSKLFAFLDKNIEKHPTDNTMVTYKNRKCSIEVNGINISSYCTVPESNVSIWSSPDNCCSVSIRSIIDGLF